MLTGVAIGVVVGVFLPVKYNLMIKTAIISVWTWVKKQTTTA